MSAQVEYLKNYAEKKGVELPPSVYDAMEAIRKIKRWLYNYGDPLDLVNDDGEGIVLDTCIRYGVVPEEVNVEVKTIYGDLTADTNCGKIDLIKTLDDPDDWMTLEDVIDDELQMSDDND